MWSCTALACAREMCGLNFGEWRLRLRCGESRLNFRKQLVGVLATRQEMQSLRRIEVAGFPHVVRDVHNQELLSRSHLPRGAVVANSNASFYYRPSFRASQRSWIGSDISGERRRFVQPMLPRLSSRNAARRPITREHQCSTNPSRLRNPTADGYRFASCGRMDAGFLRSAVLRMGSSISEWRRGLG